MEEIKKKLPVNVWVLGIVSLLNDIASEMVYPVIPIFLISVLGAPVMIVGLIEGLADSTSKILTAFTGLASDRLQKRKLFVTVGYSFATLSHFVMSIAYIWPVVLFGRVINRIGKGMRTSARDALITESTEKVNRGRSFGIHRTMDKAGAVLGPIISIFVLKALNNNYHQLFFIAFIPALIGVILIILFIKEKAKPPLGPDGMKFQWSKANDSYKIFLLISVIFTLGNSSDAFLILRSQNLGLSVGLTIFTYVLFNLTYSLFSVPAGVIADRIGARKVLFIGFLIFAFVYASFGFIDNPSYVWILFPIYGIYMALTDGVANSYISKLIPHEISASAFGIYQTLLGVSTFLASLIAGALWTYVDVKAPFYFGSSLAIIASILFLFLTKKIKVTQPIA